MPPRLTPVAPTPGRPIAVEASRFWIGSSPDCQLTLNLPGVTARHVALIEREDGYWLSPGSQLPRPVLLDGAEVSGMAHLREGSKIQIVPGATYRYSTGAARKRAARPRTTAPPSRSPPPHRTSVTRTRMRRRLRRMRPGGRGSGSGWTTRVLWGTAIALVLAAGVLLVYSLTRPAQEPATETELSEAEARLFESLMFEAYDRVERGRSLLSLGLPQYALEEFADAVNTLKTSDLGDHPWVRPRIEALEAGIGAVYREEEAQVPDAYRGARAVVDLASLLPARLTRGQFAAGIEEVQSRFQAEFGQLMVITGRDHAEHVAFYGPGGAIDVRVKDLSYEQLEFLIDNFRRLGLRVKDFSSDTVLQDQIRRAIAAGIPERAGTGRHLHVDRFTDLRDRYTVD